MIKTMMKKNILFSILSFLSAVSVFAAEEVTFTASAPQSVVQGEQFRVTYSVNMDGKDFFAPDMSDFEVLMGPSTSHSSSVQIINGSVSRNTTISYTYVLVGMNPGKHTLAPAGITVKGKKYTSNTLTVEVLPPDGALSGSQTVQGGNSTGSGSLAQGPQPSSTQIPDGEQIFVRQTFSKTEAYEQEAILVTYKLYTRYDISSIGSVKFPEFKGFYVQDINLDPNRQFKMEHYNGLNYNTIVLKQCLLFPQRAGTAELESGKVDVVLRVRNNRRGQNIFDNFFDTYSEVNKTLAIPSSKVEVKPLPGGAPDSFNGAVGHFSLESNISATELKANDALTLDLKISGNGNLRLLKNPEIKFPLDFDVYDPKVDNNIKVGTGGMSGSRNIEYLAIPRFGGEFDIPSVEFSYFDPAAKAYKRLYTPAYKIQVDGSTGGDASSAAPAVNNYSVNKEDVKNIGSDIRYIHAGNSLTPKGRFFLGSTAFYLCMGVPLLLFLTVLAALHRRAKENADIARRKTKGANKQARKRLKSAARYMKAGDKAKFYEETMKALWGYLSDKLSIPVSNLTKDNVQDELVAHNASPELAAEFLATLADCEFARFSPVADESLSMENIYAKAINLIGKLENTLKK